MSRLISIILGSLFVIISFYFGFRGNEKVLQKMYAGDYEYVGSNQLSAETSSYLLKYKDSPIHWYAWKKEAFLTALKQKKLIYLNIGHLNCEACDKMDSETLRDDAVVSLLNKSFISIKVDREEHPEIQDVYKDAVSLISRRSDYPLNVFLTADMKPFFGDSLIDSKSFFSIAERISKVWHTDPKEISDAVTTLQDLIRKKYSPK